LWYQQQISFHYRIVVMILSSDEPLANQFRWRFYVPANQFVDESASLANQFSLTYFYNRFTYLNWSSD
jgi:hypothetical protein